MVILAGNLKIQDGFIVLCTTITDQSLAMKFFSLVSQNIMFQACRAYLLPCFPGTLSAGQEGPKGLIVGPSRASLPLSFTG